MPERFPTEFFNLFCLHYLVTLVGLEDVEHYEAMMQAELCCTHLQNFMQKLC